MSPPKSRKNQISDAAIRCFNRDGYYRTSLDRIADEAGITKAGVYYHFSSKKKLFIDLFLEKADSFFDHIMAVVRNREAALDQIAYLFGKEGDLVPRDTDIVQFCVEFMTVSTRDNEIRRVVTDFYHDKINTITGIIRKGIADGVFRDIDVHTVARNLYFQSWGYFLIHYTINADFDPAKQHAVNMDIFLHGVQKHS